MKQSKVDPRIEDSLVHLLLPTARLLVRGGTGIDTLVYAAKRAYLSEAIQAVSRQKGRTNISRLSVATGMTRKEVSALLGGSSKNRDFAARKSGEQRALRVLRGWLSDPRFHNRNGCPCELKYRGGKKSFAHLVKLYGGDVTPKAVLSELERIGIVELTSTGVLRLRSSRSRSNVEMRYKLSDLARMFEDFAFAVVQSSSRSDASSFFGFRDSVIYSTRDAAYFMRKFSRRAAAFLDDFQRWSAGRDSVRVVSRPKCDTERVGLGVYLMRSNFKSDIDPSRSTAHSVEIRRNQKRHN